MTSESPAETGRNQNGPDAALVAVRISPCVGGHVRTWTADGRSQLWSVPNDTWLRAAQGTGVIARSGGGHRFEETAILDPRRGAILVQNRDAPGLGSGEPISGRVVEFGSAKRPSRSTFEDFREVLARSVRHCAASSEFLVVRPGAPGDDGPTCLFAVVAHGDADLAAVEASPPPRGSELWAPYIQPDQGASATIMAPATPDTVALVPTLMTEAIKLWNLDPWDLMLTFGPR